ncbi:MAG: ribosome biogenesis GTP-binding protein YihA/YsxC [Arsenophonus endosymbiont of Ceratovacuna japonica]
MIMINKNYDYQQTKFITSVFDIKNLPKDDGIEIAFTGYSNSGKSSALNAITKQKNLAHISKTPGKTKLINLFEIEYGNKLVDLPGYGYAKVSKSIQRKLQQILNEYLQKRKCLKGLVILMDIRYPLKDIDIKIIKYSISVNISIFILLTKSDKIIYNKQKSQILLVRKKLKSISNNIQVENFSSFKKIGIDKLQIKLNEWFNKYNSKYIKLYNK